MSKLSLPIRNRRDVLILQLADADADAAAAKIAASLTRQHPCCGACLAATTTVRIVPTDDPAYDEAVSLVIERLDGATLIVTPSGDTGGRVAAVWRVPGARVGVRLCRTDGTTREEVHSVRLLHLMTN